MSIANIRYTGAEYMEGASVTYLTRLLCDDFSFSRHISSTSSVSSVICCGAVDELVD